MHRPVDAARFAELPGAVERIDDPDAFGVEPTRVLPAFLREHGVVGTVDGELVGEELLGDGIAGVLHVPRRGAGGEHLLAQSEQQMPGLGRQTRGQLGV